jgi:hypothetical protein
MSFSRYNKKSKTAILKKNVCPGQYAANLS